MQLEELYLSKIVFPPAHCSRNDEQYGLSQNDWLPIYLETHVGVATTAVAEPRQYRSYLRCISLVIYRTFVRATGYM